MSVYMRAGDSAVGATGGERCMHESGEEGTAKAQHTLRDVTGGALAAGWDVCEVHKAQEGIVL